ncbi:MAG: CAP domain-containing protein [Pseudomonadota bacterium]|nr:CAP domain-containing protein [Pseudomonadota bacterium]
MKHSIRPLALAAAAASLSGCVTTTMGPTTLVGGERLDPNAPDWTLNSYLPDPAANTTTQANPMADGSFKTLFDGIVNTNGNLQNLTWNAQLDNAAQSYAGYLNATDQLSHTAGNSTLASRVNATGYAWRELGENLGEGQTSEAQIMAGWQNSPDHNKNLTNPNFEEFALGVSGTGSDTVWVLVLADPL